MCGIFFSARLNDAPGASIFEEISQKLQNANSTRGPDSQGLYRASVACAPDSPSPTTPHAFSLEFYASELRLRGDRIIVQPHEKDGDVLCWNGEIFDGMEISPQENDGVCLFDKLRTLETPEQIRDLFGSIEGPYAFIYYQANSRRLLFSRDPLGRRSLLIHKPSQVAPYLLLASVSAGVDSRYEFEELPTNHIYCLTFSHAHLNFQEVFNSYLISLPRLSSFPDAPTTPFAEPSQVNTILPPHEYIPQIESLGEVPEYLVKTVDDLIYHLDQSVMLRVRDIPQRSHVPIAEPIDLLNVAFENPRKIKLEAEGNTGGLSKKQKKARSKAGPSVEQPSVSYNVPDRITGLQEVEELRRLCPDRVWNFVEINVPYEESQGARQTVESLMSPGRTVMDLVRQSLAIALYFASRGVGQIRSSPGADPEPYTSGARVLLNGLGSDELLGGYGRHRTAYNTGGWQAVIDELQLEIDRIPTRNLGRDDRVISSHGKETRHPFLSLTVLEYLAKLPVHYKMDPRLEIGFGDKMLLRLAAWKLGLIGASQRKKRAMQFGSHSARMGGERRGDAILE
ncbi:hypothetical protein H0H81_003511 [Sphagnurus paluster]|uniref:Glutamine amidotransferase type-2 domain-containing protein n=1 Tax=Sphagnurus paluster TaxID=117069 RepID=A0A9P7G217_9AGAR|nr:hypothetical protein H0H81_003511 [Sphagnurus paluster]